MGITKDEFYCGDSSRPLYREWDNGTWQKWRYDDKGRNISYEDSLGHIDVVEYDDSHKYTPTLQSFCERFAAEVCPGNWKSNHCDIYIKPNGDGTYGLSLYGLGKVNWSQRVVESYESIYGPFTELMDGTDLDRYSEVHIEFYCGRVNGVVLYTFDAQEQGLVVDGLICDAKAQEFSNEGLGVSNDELLGR